MSQQLQTPSTAYRGEHLRPHPHLLALFRNQIGGFVVASPLLRGLRERFPDLALDYVGGEQTCELEHASRLVDSRVSLYGVADGLERVQRFLQQRSAALGSYDLAVNLEADGAAARACGLANARYVVGSCIDPRTGAAVPSAGEPIDALWHDTWNRPDLLDDYPQLSSQYIGEIFCRLARVETDYYRTEVPTAPPPSPVPAVLLCTGVSRSAKSWPRHCWLTIVRWLHARGLGVGLLGAPPAVQAASYHAADADAAIVAAGVADLRGQLTLPQVGGALATARAFVTVDTGLMHIAAAVGTPTLALFGASPRRLWAPPNHCVRIIEPSAPCALCEEHRFKNEACLLPQHQCMASIEPARVIFALRALLA